ncbi:MAG: NYN domain-containing protein [Bacteroidia bacterium]|nr:NYN domain-containing protein [Bacteroidia bacterium]
MANFSVPALTKIAVFYDGNYFSHVSNYYYYEHERKARLSIAGLHEFIRQHVAENEDQDPQYCHIVDAHYFRGRLNSFDANEQNRLLAERIFDDILMNEGVVTHYLPLRVRDNRIEEKGIDVWMALEAYELAIHKQFQVVALIACDGDYVPLVRKLNTLGIRVMVLGWDFEYTDERTSRQRKTVTSMELLREATYPVSMHEMIDNKIKKNDALVSNLFINKERRFVPSQQQPPVVQPQVQQRRPYVEYDPEQSFQSTIHSLKNGYGFINMPPNNLYFHYTNLTEGDFNELQEGDPVLFTIGRNDKGQDIALNVRKVEEEI